MKDETKIGFGAVPRKKVERDLADYQDEWLILGLRSGESWMGMLTAIDESGLWLHPYHEVEHSQGFPNHRLKYDGLPLFCSRQDIFRINPTTEKNACRYCDYMNRTSRRDEMLKEGEFRSKFPRLGLILPKRYNP